MSSRWIPSARLPGPARKQRFGANAIALLLALPGAGRFFFSRRKIDVISWLILVLLVATAPALAHFPIPGKKTAVGRRLVDKPVSNAVLLDQNGRKFALQDTHNKVVAITFVYTKCPDVCPLFTGKFASIQRALEQRKKTGRGKSGTGPLEYLLLTVTTDPESDTPAQLKSYAEPFKPNFSRWAFLTGTKQELAKVWKDFGVNVRKSADGHVQHTALTSLIDRHGVRRVDYYGDKWQEKEFLEDLLSLAERDRPAE
jgi:protein SCO1/2